MWLKKLKICFRKGRKKRRKCEITPFSTMVSKVGLFGKGLSCDIYWFWVATPFILLKDWLYVVLCCFQHYFSCIVALHLFTHTQHNILSKPLAVFPHNDHPNNEWQWMIVKTMNSGEREMNSVAQTIIKKNIG